MSFAGAWHQVSELENQMQMLVSLLPSCFRLSRFRAPLCSGIVCAASEDAGMGPGVS